jgi:hypothetical protein
MAFWPQCGLDREIALVGDCEDLNPTAQATAQASTVALVLRLGTGLQLDEDLQGPLVSGGNNSGRHSIECGAEMVAGVRRASLIEATLYI